MASTHRIVVPGGGELDRSVRWIGDDCVLTRASVCGQFATASGDDVLRGQCAVPHLDGLDIASSVLSAIIVEECRELAEQVVIAIRRRSCAITKSALHPATQKS